ncbi:hypothetical protein F6U93_02835 [Tamlana haliotis]|uniref:Transporter n=1 Tax=Pseudotamlana haliotis TaxID=2614804 RepID=A0A6N6MJL7_9FLAO|nr:hypothetical protein [Tamlana haliotis]KAB1069764.1 hypothetical protein F6U93_02835 [Tamlana haliotis]
MKNKKIYHYIILTVLLLSVSMTYAQDAGSVGELAKKLANPVASLISVPIQTNSDFGIGELEGSRFTANVQPVLPIRLSDDLTLITRAVIPIISQQNVTGIGNTETGLSDVVLSGFFSPTPKAGGLIWGFGPAFLVPTATEDFLGTKKFGVGPTAVALKQTKGGITLGALVNQIWSVAGDSDRADVNQFFFQPFIVKNWPSGAGVSAVFEFTQNWEGNTTNLMFNPNVSGITSVGKQKVSFSVGPKFNLIAPSETRFDFGMRAQISFLFPKAP